MGGATGSLPGGGANELIVDAIGMGFIDPSETALTGAEVLAEWEAQVETLDPDDLTELARHHWQRLGAIPIEQQREI